VVARLSYRGRSETGRQHFVGEHLGNVNIYRHRVDYTQFEACVHRYPNFDLDSSFEQHLRTLKSQAYIDIDFVWHRL
jgi:hypothetical protein